LDTYEEDNILEDKKEAEELQERKVLVKNQTGDFYNMQRKAGMSTDLLDSREA
jgi:hypothetical protein